MILKNEPPDTGRMPQGLLFFQRELDMQVCYTVNGVKSDSQQYTPIQGT